MGNTLSSTPESDDTNTNIDERIDEEKIPENIEGYPKPEAVDPLSVRNLQQQTYWFTDDNFNNASDDADLFNNDDDSVDFEGKSDEILERPKSEYYKTRKKPALSFENIDRHAKKADSSLLDSRFEELIKYLTEPVKKDKYRKIKTARAILVWLSQQKFDTGSCFLECLGARPRNKGTPRGLIDSLREGKMTYTTCYTVLCRKAGLQCVIIKGYTKGASYEPGENKVSTQTWCAVHVECGWQLVMPYWSCQGVYGQNLGGWIKVEADGKSMRKEEKASTGILVNTFQEIYFMPNPEEFIYECCALDKEWQLVKPQLNVSSFKEFNEKPYLLPTFFGMGLQLTSESKCVLKSKDGFCKIEIKTTPAKAAFLVLRYELFMKKTDNGTKTSETTDEETSRMVFNSRASETFTFDIRFPQKGEYKLVIYGGPYKYNPIHLCEFKLVCEQEMKGRYLLPLDCKDIGWGPSPASVEAGLLMPSKPNGLIPVSEKEKEAEIKFQLQSMENNYTAEVHGEVDGRRKTFDDKNVDIQKNSKLRQLVIKVSIPDKGEYGVSIAHVKSTAKAKSSEEKAKVVCTYLVSTYAYKPERANVRNAKQKLKESVALASEVEPRYWKELIARIEQNMERCKKEKVPDSDDELIAARDTLGLLKCKDKLRDCELRRNLQVIWKTLHLVSRYRNKAAVTQEIQKVETLEKEMLALQGFARQVPKLEDAHKEIVALGQAPDEVYNTFKALLVLLGENENHFQDWTEVVNRLRISTHFPEDSVLEKMQGIQTQVMSRDTQQRVLDILKKYDEKQVRKVNSDAHSFYVWIDNVVNVRNVIDDNMPASQSSNLD